MTPALALAAHLLLAADGGCNFVGNSRIIVLPTCDVGPATIAELTEEPALQSAGSLQQRRYASPMRPGKMGSPPARPVVMVRGNEELERRLELEQQQRIEELGRRLAAEHERDRAFQQREAAVRELAEARRALAAALEHLQRAERSEPGG